MTPLAVARRAVLLPLLALSLLGAVGCKHTTVDTDATLRSKLAAHREQQIQRLHAYAVAGRFPHNTSSPNDLHMFRDAEGRYCAVANLVHEDGRDDLVDATVREHNELAIHDVHDGAMMTWILESGLTQEELKRIQLPAPPMTHLNRLPQRQPTPDDVAMRKSTPTPGSLPAPPLRATVDVRDEDALKALVRAHLAQVESELRAHEDASLRLAVERAHAAPAPARVASR